MLEDFKLSQENFYHEVIQFGLHQKFSHAYLIETKDYLDSDNLVLAFAKFLYCPYHYTNSSNCGDCNRCHLIDLSTNSDIMVISPDGSWIKKEQVQEIKDKFMTTSLENNVRIYNTKYVVANQYIEYVIGIKFLINVSKLNSVIPNP